MGDVNFTRAALVAFVMLVGSHSHAGVAVRTEPDVVTRLRRIIKPGHPGIAVLVSQDGRIIYHEEFGLADVEKKELITLRTKFHIASMSKQFTAAAILKLAEQGRLSVHDPIAKYFPDFPKPASITVHQLMTHTSGMGSYTDEPGSLVRQRQPIAPEALLDEIRNGPFHFEPGKNFRYSNSGYVILGHIVVKVAGKPLDQVLQEMFFDPLGMRDTGVYHSACPPRGLATGYIEQNGAAMQAPPCHESWTFGAGGLYSTAGDLFRWNEALYGGRVLSEASLRAALTPVEYPMGGVSGHYGYGVLLQDIEGAHAVTHAGMLPGWLCDIIRLIDHRCTIVVLSNAQPGVPGASSIDVSREFARAFLNGAFSQPKESADGSRFGS